MSGRKASGGGSGGKGVPAGRLDEPTDDGKRAFSAIEVACQAARPLSVCVSAGSLDEPTDDGKRAFSAIEVAGKAASPLGRGGGSGGRGGGSGKLGRGRMRTGRGLIAGLALSAASCGLCANNLCSVKSM